MNIETFFDTRTFTMTYLIWDADTKDALVIDAVIDYDPEDSRVWYESVDKVDAVILENALTLHYVLETHAHADHLSGAQELKRRHPGAKIAIGDKIHMVQEVFKPVFELGDDFQTDGSQFDQLLADNEILKAGAIEIKAIATPGHTPACMSFLIEDAVFTGDALFLPDSGTGRCDFPAGSADDLYRSVQERLYSLPDETRVFVGHDYQPGDRGVQFESTIGEEKAANIQLTGQTSREAFVDLRNTRDATLDAPRLLFQSVQVNIDAGNLPAGSTESKAKLRTPAQRRAS